MEGVDRIAMAVAEGALSERIEVAPEKDAGGDITLDFTIDGEMIGYMSAHLMSVDSIEEIWSDVIEDGFYANDLSGMLDGGDRVMELGRFFLFPQWRHRHLAKPCFQKGLDWLERNKNGFSAFVGRALAGETDMAKGLDQPNLIGFYESMGFDVIGDYGEWDGAIIVKEV